MEDYSFLRKPDYGNYYGNLPQHNYNSRYGHPVTLYEPIYEEEQEVLGGYPEDPYVPYERSYRSTSSLSERHSTADDMIQMNLSSRSYDDLQRRYNDYPVPTYYEPTYEDMGLKYSGLDYAEVPYAPAERCYRSSSPYISQRSIDERIQNSLRASRRANEALMDYQPPRRYSYESARELRAKKDYKPIREARNVKFDFTRNICKKSTSDDEMDPPETAVQMARRAKISADQFKAVLERYKNRETESDYFERTYGAKLSKLRGEVNTLGHQARSYRFS